MSNPIGEVRGDGSVWVYAPGDLRPGMKLFAEPQGEPARQEAESGCDLPQTADSFNAFFRTIC
jgi:hypothetical protein